MSLDGGAQLAIVRPEDSADAAAIRSVLVASFLSDAEARLVELLRDAGHLTVSLVAEMDGLVVGHVGFSPVSTDSDEIGVGLAPLAVLSEYRCQGIGAELVTRGLAACATLGSGWAVVLGAPGYYSRFGFRAAGEAGLVGEFGGGPAFQVVELRAGSLPIGGGLVRYSLEFASLA
jgi:putative acetyltransferase